MADIIHNLSVGGTSRPLGTVHYIEGTGTTEGTWLGSDPSISAYYDGLTIAYKVNIAGASPTTLNINSLGAKTVRRNASNVTTHYPVNSVIHLTYTTIDGTSYWQCADYDTDADKKTTSGNTSSKIYLVGATKQSTSGLTTYSHDTAYVGTDGCLYSNGKKVALDEHTHTTTIAASDATNQLTLAHGSKYAITAGGTSFVFTMPSDNNTDTKNTAGSSNTSSKIYLVGATSQAASATTYSHDTAYVGTDGCLYSNGSKVLTSHQSVTNSAPTLAWGTTSTVGSVGGTALTVTMPANPNTDTKNTAGSSNTASKIYLIGSTSQVSSGTTYSQDTAYVGTDGHLYSNSSKVFSTSYAPEAYLEWGGKNFAGGWSPIDAAMVPKFAANRFAFLPASAITLEYSTDGGSTWTAKNDDEAKKNLFATSGSFYIGNNSSTGIDKKNYKCRVTITTTGVVYSTLNKFAIRVSTNGSTGCHVKLESRSKANQDAGNNAWATNVERAELSGWSGWNIINVPGITTHGNNSVQYSQLRFTFGVDKHESTSTNPGLQILCIMAFGGEGWTTCSNMAREGHLYSYDADQNATFPAALNTTGNLTENGTRVSKVGHTHTVSGVPTSASFSGTTATLTTSTSSNTTVATNSHTHTTTSTGSYTPAGTNSAPTFTGSAATSGGASATQTIYQITGVGSAPSLSASIANNCMTFTWSAGSVPSRSSVDVALASHTHSVTAKGSVSAPTFTGTAATISVSGTSGGPSATVNVAAASHTHTVTHTPAGNVSLTTGNKTTSASTT